MNANGGLNTPGLNAAAKTFAYKWLGEKDQEAKRRNEAAQAEQGQIARTTKNAAMAAIAIAVLSLVISILAWLFPRH